MLTHVYRLPKLTQVDPCLPSLPMFTHVYPCLPFTHVYPLSMFTHFYPCLPLVTHAYSCLPMFTLVTYVYPYLSLFIHVYICLPLLINVYICSLMFTHIYSYYHKAIYSYLSIVIPYRYQVAMFTMFTQLQKTVINIRSYIMPLMEREMRGGDDKIIVIKRIAVVYRFKSPGWFHVETYMHVLGL